MERIAKLFNVEIRSDYSGYPGLRYSAHFETGEVICTNSARDLYYAVKHFRRIMAS